MADDADRASEHDERLLSASVAAVRARTACALYTGQCLNCEEFIPAPKRWCDADCRDRWEREQGL